MNREVLKAFLLKCYGYTFRDVDTVMKYFDDVYKENGQLKLKQEDFIKWLEEQINKDKSHYKVVWQNDNGNRCEQINSSEIIMKPSYVIYQEVLDKFRGARDE